MQRHAASLLAALLAPLSAGFAAASGCSNGLAPPPLPEAGTDTGVIPRVDTGAPPADAGAGTDADATMAMKDATVQPEASIDVVTAVDVAHDVLADVGLDAGTDALTYAVPDAWNGTYTQPSDTTAAESRAACMYTRGAMPAQTTGPSTALGTAIPVEHIIVLMQENRSFDSYFGHLQAYEADAGLANTIESPPATTTNPTFPKDQVDGGVGGPDAGDAAGPVYPWIHAPQLCSYDTNHSWQGAHLEYDDGLNDGFYYANTPFVDTGNDTNGIAPAQLSGARALWWYDQRDLPFYYSLYSTFAMGDHYFSALLGPTYTNRMYLYSGTSFGLTDNTFPDISAYPTPETPVIIFDELAIRGIKFRWYTDGVASEDVVFGTELIGPASPMSRYGYQPVASFQQFLSDAMAGTLPAVSFVDGNNSNETPTGNDEHPPAEIQIGQQFVWQIVNAVTTGPLWKNTVLFVTYDENGGLYDHVPPPSACEPDKLQPVFTNPQDQSQPGAFNRYGFRVPMVAISPYSKKNYVSHAQYSHTSITRFIEAKFNLPALTARDANEDPLTDMFDWQAPPFMTPPTFPQPSINDAGVGACAKELTPTP